MTTVQIEFPFPVSLNNAFGQARMWSKRQQKHVVRRFKSNRYEAWCRAADMTVMAARAPKLQVPVKISITLHPPDNRARDADNTIKSIVDSLVRMAVIQGDSRKFVRGVAAVWGEVRNPPIAEVCITAA